MKSSAKKVELASVDDLFSTEESRTDAQREKVMDKYYHFVRAEQEEDFDEFIAKCKELALYDTGVSAEYGDKLITLSTCEYSRTNGRMVVVAKLLEE